MAEYPITDLKKYYRCQTDICFHSELFGSEIHKHGSKVLMLFAEIYSFLVLEFGLNFTPDMITKYGNSKAFKHWFWQIKHRLGEELKNEPNFNDIGKWIGKGFFLKIILNLLKHSTEYITNYSVFKDTVLDRVVNRQRALLRHLMQENYFSTTGAQAIEEVEDGYILLNEKVILNPQSEYFFNRNLISD